MKQLFAALLLAGVAFGQSPTSLSPFDLRQGWAVGSPVNAWQIVKFDSIGRVVPIAAGDSSRAAGVAADGSSFPGSIPVVIMGNARTLVDNTCSVGQFVNYSATVAGSGTCSASPNNPTIGVVTQLVQKGLVYVHISPTASAGGGPLLFSGVPTGTCSAAQTAINTTNGDFYSCNAGSWSKVATSVLLFAGAPTGTCTAAQTAVNTTNGDFYSCNGGIWNKINGGAAGAGGSTTQMQRNNGGTLAGVATLTSTGTVTTAFGGPDWIFIDPTDNTKQLEFNLVGITSGNIRTVSVPDAASAFAVPITCTNQVLSAMSSFGVFTCHTLVAADLPAAVVFNNQANTYSGGGLQDLSAMKFKPPTSIVSGLPTASSNTNILYEVTDGVSSSDCTVGGGATRSLCVSNGTSWVSVGGSGGGSGTVNSGSGYAIPAYGTAASTTVGPSNITTDSTDNNLNIPGYMATGTPPGGVASTAKGGIACAENAITGWTPTAGTDYQRCDSTVHEYLISLNGASELPMALIDGDLGGTSAAVTVTNGSHITNASIPNSGLQNSSTTVNGVNCALGGTCSVGGGGGGSGQVSVPIDYPIEPRPIGLSLTSAQTVTNTSSATSIIGSTFQGRNTIPAGTMVMNGPGLKTIKITAAGTISITGSPTLSLTVLLGGQTLSTIAVPLAATMSGNGFSLDYSITVTGNATALVGGCVHVTGASNAELIQCASGSASSLNFATSQVIDVQVTWSAPSSSNTVVANQLAVYPAHIL